MATTLTKLSVNLSGKENVTELAYANSFTLDEKLEKTIKLNNSSETIDYSYISNPKTIIFKGDGVFNVLITKDANVITFQVDKIYTARFADTFLTEVTSIEIAEINSIDVEIEVRVYGETV